MFFNKEGTERNEAVAANITSLSSVRKIDDHIFSNSESSSNIALPIFYALYHGASDSTAEALFLRKDKLVPIFFFPILSIYFSHICVRFFSPLCYLFFVLVNYFYPFIYLAFIYLLRFFSRFILFYAYFI